jgi:hypothetical protein
VVLAPAQGQAQGQARRIQVQVQVRVLEWPLAVEVLVPLQTTAPGRPVSPTSGVHPHPPSVAKVEE